MGSVEILLAGIAIAGPSVHIVVIVGLGVNYVVARRVVVMVVISHDLTAIITNGAHGSLFLDTIDIMHSFLVGIVFVAKRLKSNSGLHFKK